MQKTVFMFRFHVGAQNENVLWPVTSVLTEGQFASILALTLWISSSLVALDKEYSLLVKGAN